MATIGRPTESNPYGNITMKNTLPEFGEVKYKKVSDHVQMGKDGFLQLLTHQLANQDPLNPMDSDKISAELAQFSQLEQLTSINESINQGQKKSDSVGDRFYSATLLGKKVSSTSTNFTFAGRPIELPVHLKEAAQNLMLRIYDSRGQIVGQIEKDNLVPGDHRFAWDGISFDGQMITPGEYTFEVLAWDQTGMKLEVDGKSTGTVTGVNFIGDEIILEIDGKQKVSLKDIESFK